MDICVHQVGGFRMKGIDKVANVVQVMPTSLAGRVQWLLPSNTTRVSSQLDALLDVNHVLMVVHSHAFGWAAQQCS